MSSILDQTTERGVTIGLCTLPKRSPTVWTPEWTDGDRDPNHGNRSNHCGRSEIFEVAIGAWPKGAANEYVDDSSSASGVVRAANPVAQVRLPVAADEGVGLRSGVSMTRGQVRFHYLAIDVLAQSKVTP